MSCIMFINAGFKWVSLTRKRQGILVIKIKYGLFECYWGYNERSIASKNSIEIKRYFIERALCKTTVRWIALKIKHFHSFGTKNGDVIVCRDLWLSQPWNFSSSFFSVFYPALLDGALRIQKHAPGTSIDMSPNVGEHLFAGLQGRETYRRFRKVSEIKYQIFLLDINWRWNSAIQSVRQNVFLSSEVQPFESQLMLAKYFQTDNRNLLFLLFKSSLTSSVISDTGKKV